MNSLFSGQILKTGFIFRSNDFIFHLKLFPFKNKKQKNKNIYKQPSKFISTVGNCQGFCRGKQCFYSNHLGKNIAEVIICSKMYIQSIIFNTYLSTKLSFTNKRYHLHVLEKCLYVLQEVRSIIYFWQFIHPLSLRSCGNGTSFAFTSYIIESTKFCNIKFLNNFYFVSFFYHLFKCSILQ